MTSYNDALDKLQLMGYHTGLSVNSRFVSLRWRLGDWQWHVTEQCHGHIRGSALNELGKRALQWIDAHLAHDDGRERQLAARMRASKKEA